MPNRNRPVRNSVARSPLLRKGGPHIQSKTSQRVRSRIKLNSAIDEWLEGEELDSTLKGTIEGSENSPYSLQVTENYLNFLH